MSDQSTPRLVPIAQALGITGASFLAGFGFAFSYVSIPVILKTLSSTDIMAKQWLATYHLGKATGPPIAVTCALCFGYLAVQSRDRQGLFPSMSFDPTSPWALYTAAAVAVPSIVPFTLTMMAPTNNKLIEAAAKPSILTVNETRELLSKWKALNYQRQMLGIVAAALGAIATLMP